MIGRKPEFLHHLLPELQNSLPELQITHREGEVSFHTEKLPYDGSLTVIEFGRDLPPGQQQEFGFTFEDQNIEIQSVGLRRAKDRGSIPGSGDYGTQYILHHPGLFTVNITRGCDGLPPIDADWWRNLIEHDDNKEMVAKWLKQRFPDLNPDTMHHPDVIHSAIQSAINKPEYHFKIHQFLRDLYVTLANVIPNDKQVLRFATDRSEWLESRQSAVGRETRIGNVIPYPSTKHIISMAQLDLLRTISVERVSKLNGLRELFFPVLHDVGLHSDQFFNWFFNSIFAQTMTVIMHKPVMFDGQKSQIITSRFMSTADCVAHTDFHDLQLHYSPIPNSNIGIDALIERYIKNQEPIEIIIRELLLKTESSYRTFVSNAHGFDYYYMAALNGLYGLTTEPVVTDANTDSTHILTSVQSDGELVPQQPFKGIQDSRALKSITNMRLKHNFERQGNPEDDGLNLSTRITVKK